jgi:hypothetical protein
MFGTRQGWGMCGQDMQAKPANKEQEFDFHL